MTYRQQLRRARAALAPTAPEPRRRVRAGEAFDVEPGELLDVVTDVGGADVVLVRVTATERGRFTLG
jgi:hypothetical protein